METEERSVMSVTRNEAREIAERLVTFVDGLYSECRTAGDIIDDVHGVENQLLLGNTEPYERFLRETMDEEDEWYEDAKGLLEILNSAKGE